jgi:hypothetical protein
MYEYNKLYQFLGQEIEFQQNKHNIIAIIVIIEYFV